MSTKYNMQPESMRTTSFILSTGGFLTASILAGFIAFIVFLPATGNDFVNWDDRIDVYENKHIMSLDEDFIKWIFFNQETQWGPLRWFSHAIDYRVWGLDPRGHHLTSIILHSLNTFLVVLLVSALFAASRVQGSSPLSQEHIGVFHRKVLVTGIVTGLLFGLHPLRVEPVTWIAARKEVLLAFFFLLSLILYLKYAGSPEKGQRKFLYFLCLTSFHLALMGKTTACSLPLIFILLDVHPLKRIDTLSMKRHGRVLAEKLPFLPAAIAAPLFNVSIHRDMGAVTPLEIITLAERIIVSFKSLVFYMEKTVWPTGLAALHSYPFKHEISVSRFEYLGPIILTAVITAFCILMWKKGSRIWLVAWVFFASPLLALPGIIKIGGYFAAERYSYIPGIAPFLLTGIGVSMMWEKACRRSSSFLPWKALVVLIVTLFTIVMSILTIRQINVWDNSISLWSHTLKLYPYSSIAYMNRGSAYFTSSQNHKALHDLTNAVRIDKNNEIAYKTRGAVFARMGKNREALAELGKAIEINPEFSEAYSNRCGVHIQVGNYAEAVKDCSIAIDMKPENAMAYNNRGLSYSSSGEFARAVDDYSRAIALDPGNPGFYRNRGAAFTNLGKVKDAVSDYQKAARLGDKAVRDLLRRTGISW
jgi:Flp pilus assembly protein TadD